MALRSPSARSRPEPTIALINIVFLMLIFFMIAGTLAPPLDDQVKLVSTEDLEGRDPPDVAILTSAGDLFYRGAPTTTPDIIARAQNAGDTIDIRIVVDRDVPATVLMRHVSELRSQGAASVWIVTERGL
ncbi:ExbD/TolR family protein [Yoonia sp. MH D7]